MWLPQTCLCRTIHAGKHPHPPRPCKTTLSSTPPMGREGEETGEVFALWSKDWNSRSLLDILGKHGLSVTEVYNKAKLAAGRTLRGRGLRLALGALHSPFLALILWGWRELLA